MSTNQKLGQFGVKTVSHQTRCLVNMGLTCIRFVDCSMLLGCIFGFIAGYSAVCDAFLFSMQLLPSLYSNKENYIVVAREKHNIEWGLSPSVIYSSLFDSFFILKLLGGGGGGVLLYVLFIS